jgi:hypothetical protein
MPYHLHSCRALLLVAVALAACSSGDSGGGDAATRSETASGTPDTSARRDTVVSRLQPSAAVEGDTDTLARLEREARALAKSSGCTSSAECRTAPVGAKACGGPRYWLAYCAATTDSAALFRKLNELKAAEQAYNKAHGVVSDCSFAAPPPLQAVGGSCRAQRAQ